MNDPAITVLDQTPPFSGQLMAELGCRGLHVGCGRNLKAGWLNMDAMALTAKDGQSTQTGRIARVQEGLYYLQFDATKPLPLDDDCVSWAYSEHFIEHLSLEQAVAWLGEIRRVLRPAGLLRLSTPDLRKYIAGYIDPDGRFYSLHRQRLEQMGIKDVPHRRAWMINQIFQSWGHRWVYDYEELAVALRAAGFDIKNLRECAFRNGSNPSVSELDLPIRNDESLYVEINA